MKKIFSSLVVLSMVAISTSFIGSSFVVLADHDPFGGVPQTSVTICHTGNGTNFVSNSPSINSHDGSPNGHEHHEDDIIPPYHYLDNQDNPGSYAGQNWDTEGQGIWNNDCVVPAPSVDACPNDAGIQTSTEDCTVPPPTTSDITVCKQDGEGTPLPGWTMQLHDNLPQNLADQADQITDANGCVVFEDVPHTVMDGETPVDIRPEIFEVLQEGWTFDSVSCEGATANGDGNLTNDGLRAYVVIEMTSPAVTCTFINIQVIATDNSNVALNKYYAVEGFKTSGVNNSPPLPPTQGENPLPNFTYEKCRFF